MRRIVYGSEKFNSRRTLTLAMCRTSEKTENFIKYIFCKFCITMKEYKPFVYVLNLD
jgi:hypothetical protein